MPTVQSTYLDNLLPAVAGARATMQPAVIVSRTVETAAGIGFGIAVEQGTADKQCKLFDGGTVFGITLLDRGASGLDPATGIAAENEYGLYESAAILLKGDVWVVSTTGNVAGDPVYVRPSNNTFQNSSANSGVLIANARWDTTATAGNLAVVYRG